MTSRSLYDQFIRDRRFLKNVSRNTEVAYESAWKRIGPHLPEDYTKWNNRVLLEAVIKMRQSGLGAISCNCHIRSFNAFLRWAHEQEHLPSLLKLPKQVEEKKVPSTLTDQQVASVLAWKPFDVEDRRIYTLLVFLADTGTRINEALTLEWDRLDFDNFLVTVWGKGRKERILPISVECRKILWQWKRFVPAGRWVFGTRNGTPLSYRNALRDFERIKTRLGIVGNRKAFHAVRHTFATNFIGGGGDAFKLQRMLGHTSITTTQKYVHLATQHLSKEHEQRSLLTKRATK